MLTWEIFAAKEAFLSASLTASADHDNRPSCAGGRQISRYGHATAEIDARNVQFLEWTVVATDRKTGRKLDAAPTFFTLLTRVDVLSVVPQHKQPKPTANELESH